MKYCKVDPNKFCGLIGCFDVCIRHNQRLHKIGYALGAKRISTEIISINKVFVVIATYYPGGEPTCFTFKTSEEAAKFIESGELANSM